MRHKRAIKRLVNKLGGYRPYHDQDLDAVSTQEEEPEQHQDPEENILP
jgi:hypothetical protein